MLIPKPAEFIADHFAVGAVLIDAWFIADRRAKLTWAFALIGWSPVRCGNGGHALGPNCGDEFAERPHVQISHFCAHFVDGGLHFSVIAAVTVIGFVGFGEFESERAATLR
ncbi:MAG TPA: hypothetical protein VNH11_06300 [Pirellulales bacterium]|nr:hypothetical protein [Pirellulales bacterium]